MNKPTGGLTDEVIKREANLSYGSGEGNVGFARRIAAIVRKDVTKEQLEDYRKILADVRHDHDVDCKRLIQIAERNVEKARKDERERCLSLHAATCQRCALKQECYTADAILRGNA